MESKLKSMKVPFDTSAFKFKKYEKISLKLWEVLIGICDYTIHFHISSSVIKLKWYGKV